MMLCIVMLCLVFPVTSYGQGSLGLNVGGPSSGPMVPNPAAIFWNPAALAGIEGRALMFDIGLVMARGDYQRAPDSNFSFYPEVSANAIFPIPLLGYVDNFGLKRWRFGFAIYTPFGTGGSWDPDGPQRYHLIQGLDASIATTAAAAFKVSDRFSVGLGVTYLFSALQGQLALDLAPRLFDLIPPSIALATESPLFTAITTTGLMTSHNFAINGGFFFQPTDDIDLGIGGQIPVRLNNIGTVEVTLPDTVALGEPILDFLGFRGQTIRAQGRISILRPGFLSAGAGWRPGPDLALEGVLTYVFSSMNSTFVSELFGTGFAFLDSPEGTSTRQTGANDSYQIKVGGRYQLNPNFMIGGYLTYIEGGIASQFVNASGVGFDLLIPTWLMQYRYKKEHSFGLSINPLFVFTRTITNSIFDPTALVSSGIGLPPANGTYSGIGIQIGFTYSRSF